MCKKIVFVVVALVFAIGISGISYAMCGMCGAEAKDMGAAAAQGKAVDVGNKVCPVSGDKIEEKSKVTQEYDGKVYNLCCPACIEPFKKDPKKYVDIVDKESKAPSQQVK